MRSRVKIGMEQALAALMRDEALTSQPDEETFKKAGRSGGHHAQTLICEAGVSDEDRLIIVSYLNRAVEVVEGEG